MRTTTDAAHPRTRSTPTRWTRTALAALMTTLATWIANAQPTATPSTVPSPSPAAATPNHTAASALAERLQALYPATRFGAVTPTAWNGVFEVAMGANIAYVDASGQYFLFGHFYDMKAQRDLTAERKEHLARVDFGQLPLADALKEVRGTGARTLAIFSDPDCPYCQKLEADLRTLTDVTIHTFLMPLVSLHPGAHTKAVSIWCASDPLSTWRAAMLHSEPVPRAECPHPVDRNIALGERLGIQGTPTLIAADGRMLSGAAGRDQIEAWLQRAPAVARPKGTAQGTP